MKQYLFFTGLIFFIVIGCIFFLEKTDFLHLRELDISAKVYEEDGTVTLRWERPAYPCYYRVDTYIKTTGTGTDKAEFELVKTEFTTTPSYRISSAPIPCY